MKPVSDEQNRCPDLILLLTMYGAVESGGSAAGSLTARVVGIIIMWAMSCCFLALVRIMEYGVFCDTEAWRHGGTGHRGLLGG